MDAPACEAPKKRKGITNEMIYIDPEMMKAATEAELSKKVLERFDEYEEKVESFQF